MTCSGTTLTLRLAGHYGHGDENLSSGRKVLSALEEALEDAGEGLTALVIDFVDVDGIGGDGPVWSVMPAIRQGIDVRFVACGQAYDWLKTLLAATSMDHFTKLQDN